MVGLRGGGAFQSGTVVTSAARDCEQGRKLKLNVVLQDTEAGKKR